MPTYEFRCPDGHTFEKFYRKISDATGEVHCPECGKVATRLMSAGAGLLFKGSGFYLTDYGKNAHRKAGPGVKPGAASGGESGASGGDAPSSGASAEPAKAETTPSAAGASGGAAAGTASSTPAPKPPKPKSDS